MDKEQDKSMSYIIEQNKIIKKQDGSLFGDYTRWTTKEVVRLLEKFCKSPEALEQKCRSPYHMVLEQTKQHLI